MYVEQAGGDSITGQTQITISPTVANDIVNKNYVDTNFLKLTGGTLTGQTQLTISPSNQNDVTNKNYVDYNSGYIPNLTSINTSTYSNMRVRMDNFTVNNTITNQGTANTIIFSNGTPANQPVLSTAFLSGFTPTGVTNFKYLGFNGTSQFLSTNTTSNNSLVAPCTIYAVVAPSVYPTGTSRFFSINGNIAVGMRGSFGQMILTTFNVKDYVTITTPSISLNSWNIIAYRFNSNFTVDFDLNGRSNSNNNYTIVYLKTSQDQQMQLLKVQH